MALAHLKIAEHIFFSCFTPIPQFVVFFLIFSLLDSDFPILARISQKVFICSHITLSEGEVKVLVAQSCLIFCNPMFCSLPGILQARILEWVAISFSRALHDPGTEPRSPALQADSLLYELSGKP